MNIEELRGQHGQIMQLAAELHRAVDQGDGVRPVAALRWRLARELIAHLAMEDRLLYPSMIRSRDAKVAGTATHLKAEMGGLASEFTAYMAAWSDLRVAREWEAFRSETRVVLDRLADRIRREDETLYPLADALSRAA
jgi:iron-sulfur cluster repair protein YtfE (RIC family)